MKRLRKYWSRVVIAYQIAVLRKRVVCFSFSDDDITRMIEGKSVEAVRLDYFGLTKELALLAVLGVSRNHTEEQVREDLKKGYLEWKKQQN